MRRLLVVLSVVAVAVVVGVAVGVSTGNAGYPGTNGLILVDAWTGSSQDIATFDPAANEVHYLVRTASFSEHEPRASADGKKIAYVRRVQEYPTTPPGPADIWVMNADGTGQTQLTDNSLDEQLPMFAPDGRILFSRCVDGPRDCDIWIMNSDGSGQKNLTDLDGWQGFPAASPDGKKIAFTSCLNDTCKIWLMKMDGTAKSQLTFGPDVYSQADWSPSGNSIAFDRWNPNTNEFGLMIMKSNGTDLRTLYDAIGKAEQFPTWSPDGTKIAYTDNTGGAGNILVLEDLATGTSQQVLTPRGTPTTEYSFGYPSWIPTVKKTR